MKFLPHTTEFGRSWVLHYLFAAIFFFQAEDGIRGIGVTGVQTCALPIWPDGAGDQVLAAEYGGGDAPHFGRGDEVDAREPLVEGLGGRAQELSRAEPPDHLGGRIEGRSEERRVGKEWRSGWSAWQRKKKW